MKKILIAFSIFALAGAGCASSGPAAPSPTPTNPPPSETPQAGRPLDTPVTFGIGESITFQDGATLKLTAINDSRCKPDVQCVWAGELAPTFTFYAADQTTEEFSLGTVRAAQATVKDHVISLKNATTEQATITVSRK